MDSETTTETNTMLTAKDDGRTVSQIVDQYVVNLIWDSYIVP